MSITEKLGMAGIPGFRSGKWWKMIIAVPVYLFIAFSVLLVLAVILSGPPTKSAESTTGPVYLYPKAVPTPAITAYTPTAMPTPIPTLTALPTPTPIPYIWMEVAQITADTKKKNIVFYGKVFNVDEFEMSYKDMRTGDYTTPSKEYWIRVTGISDYTNSVVVDAADWMINGTIVNGVTVEVYGKVSDQWQTIPDYYGNNKVLPYISADKVIVQRVK